MATKAKDPAKQKQAPKKKASKQPLAPRKSGTAKAPTAGGKKPRVKPEGSDKAKKGKDVEPEDAESRRRLGIRGAAPWAARHAAKHAAEARARAAEPPPPGSARATLRIPTGAEELKVRLIDLHNCMVEIKSLRRNMQRNFFAVGLVLQGVRDRTLYEARGFGSFETFLEREFDLGKTTAFKLVLAVEVFQREAAEGYGMDKVFAALSALESKHKPQAATQSAAGGGATRPPLPMRPPTPHKLQKK